MSLSPPFRHIIPLFSKKETSSYRTEKKQKSFQIMVGTLSCTVSGDDVRFLRPGVYSDKRGLFGSGEDRRASIVVVVGVCVGVVWSRSTRVEYPLPSLR